MRCPACRGTGSYVGRKCEVCAGKAILPDTRLDQPLCARCRADGRLLSTVCDVCQGWGRLPPEEPSPQIWYVAANSAYQAHEEIAEIFQSLTGEVCVCDPYYGAGSLARLAELSGCTSVRFLTKTPDRNEKSYLPRRIQEFRKTHGHIEFRKYPGSDLHDRFVLTDSEFIILGHGIKDIGGKDSFVVRIQRDIAEDTIDSVRKAFDAKWCAAKAHTLT